MPSILIINRVFPPAGGATGQLLSELTVDLRKHGWRVDVICDNVRNCNRTKAGLWLRIASCLMLYPKLLLRAMQLPHADVVVTMTDPPLQIILGTLVSWLKGSPHVHWAQDIYPEVAEELGVIRKNGLLARCLRAISTAAMRQASFIVAIGDCMKDRLVHRGIRPEKIAVVPNWGSSNHPPSREAIDEFRRSHGFDGRFTVMYSGNLGLAHCFEAVLDAAESLQVEAPQVAFVFVGDGARAAEIQRQTHQRQLRNVWFLPPQPREMLDVALAAGNLHLASMREELCGLVVPSKVYGVLAAGRSCFFIGPQASEAAQIIIRHKLGRVFGTRDAGALAGSIARWSTEIALICQAQQRVDAIADQFRIASATKAFQHVLKQALSQGTLRAGTGSPSPLLPSRAKGASSVATQI